MFDEPSWFGKEVAFTTEVTDGFVFGLGGIVRTSAVNTDRALVGVTGVRTGIARDVRGDHSTSKVLDEFDGCIVRRSSILTKGARRGVLGGRAAAQSQAFSLHLGAIFAVRIGDGAGLIH